MKQDLIILHGALGAKAQFTELAALLSDTFTIHLFNFEGHGGRPSEHPFTIELFTQNLIDYVVGKELDEFSIFGYSMGGYIALNASSEGLFINKVMTLATKFDWTPEGAQKEIKLLNPSIIEEKVPKFAAYQAKLHAPEDWKSVMQKTANMMIGLGNSPVLTDQKLNSIDIETLCCLGSKDVMVSREETEHTVSQLNNSSLHIFDEFEHPIEKINISELAKMVTNFFT